MNKPVDYKTSIKLNRYLIIGLIILALGFAFTSTDSQQVNKMVQGIHIQLGHESIETKMSIQLQGTLDRSLILGPVFSGKLYLDGEEYICNKERHGNKLSSNITKIVDGQTTTFGQLFYDKQLSQITILTNVWNNGDGFMIVAPATNRDEALRISNDVLSNFLEDGSMAPLE